MYKRQANRNFFAAICTVTGFGSAFLIAIEKMCIRDRDNAGLLDPFVIMKNVKDAESLAIDILTFLTGISSRDGEKFPVLRKACLLYTSSSFFRSVSRGVAIVMWEQA